MLFWDLVKLNGNNLILRGLYFSNLLGGIRAINHICLGVCLDYLLCSIGLCVYPFAILYCLEFYSFVTNLKID